MNKPKGISFNEAIKKVAPSPGQRERMIKQIKDNLNLLDSCSGPHVFIKRIGSNNVIKYHCSKCRGIIDRAAHKWYTQGLEHAKKS